MTETSLRLGGGMRQCAESESDWLNAHVYYHGDRTALVVEAIAPLMRECLATGLSDGWFFLRDRVGGPHVRLRILPAHPDARAGLQRVVADRLTGYLSVGRPSTVATIPQQYDVPPAAANMADHAGLPQPNNAVVFQPYRRERDRYGDGFAVQAVERHFTESSAVAAALLASPGWPERRVTVGFCLLLLTWVCGQPDLKALVRQAATSPQGWSWTLVGSSIEDPDVERDFRERYEIRRDGLLALADDVRRIAARAEAGKGTASLSAWARSVVILRKRLAHLVAAGHFTPSAVGAPGKPTAEEAATAEQEAAAGPGEPNGHAEAEVFRVLDSCAHLVCNRLDINLHGESYLRYLAARAATDLAERER
ncbi:hypothetical protein OG216_40640 [Streptomycetaceae bacterium NBC_01309]